MNFFNKLSVGARLWAAIVAIMLALVAVTAYSHFSEARLSEESDRTLNIASKKVQLATRWSGLVQTNVVRTQAAMVSADPAVTTMYKDEIPASIEQIGVLLKELNALPMGAEEKALLERIAALRQGVIDASNQARKAKADGDLATMNKAMSEGFNPKLKPYFSSLDEFAALQGTLLERAQRDFSERRAAIARLSAILVGLFMLLLIAGAWLLIRNIRTPLLQVVTFAQRIASGDLTARITATRSDEFGTMSQALSDMREQLVSVVSDVRRGTDNITVASQEIASGNHDLSSRTEQTASNLEETAASMEEMSGAIKQSADSARVASQLADVAGQSAQQGGQVVDQVIQTMEQINQASRKINDIISVIDGIAFQTNILALNAAVEAARAGEQGRGFAVVAGEVRNLAGRAAEAAKEIKGLIGNSVDRVTVGSELVNQAGQTMQEIVSNVARVRDIIGEIASSASEQADGVNQINAAIANLDQMTQQNAALVEQSASAASSMSEQAARLSQVVNTFQIDNADLASSSIAQLQMRAPQRAASLPRAAAAPATMPAAATRPPLTSSAKPTPAPKLASKGSDDTGEWESF